MSANARSCPLMSIVRGANSGDHGADLGWGETCNKCNELHTIQPKKERPMNLVNWRLEQFLVVFTLTGLFLLAGIIALPAQGQDYKRLAQSQAGLDEAPAPAVNHNT